MSATVTEAPAKPAQPKFTRKDFLSEVTPRWCPGCGTYGVLSALTRVFATLDTPHENYALISGIGCSARLPYYSSTFGFHTIHGRAPAVASGLKITRPELSVWVITGDGDALSIGGNHFIHLMRRNIDLKVILFNNQIYGLTKGQTSPTSAMGTKTKSTPFGSTDMPLRPLSVAIAAGATFAARAPDTDIELLSDVLTAAAKHKGTAFVEVLLNCVIFNDGAFDELTDKKTKADQTIRLRAGEPMIYGANKDRGIAAQDFKLKTVDLQSPDAAKPLIHNPANPDPELAYALSRLDNPEFPVPVGVFRQVSAPTFEDGLYSHTNKEELDQIMRGGNSWKVEWNGEGSFEG
jgi:2-oxoglutarate ferredoxin oxidoreductase subunit beta